MGTKSQSPIEDRSPRQLYRSESDRIVAGICGGLGRYFGMDPIVVRALFVLVTLVGGSGGLFYLILWLIIPAEPRDRVLSERVVQPEVPQLEGDFEVTTGLKIKNCWWGLVLISLGLVFLFSNLGFFNLQSILKLWRLWPLFLVGFGLALLFGSC